MVDGVSNWKSVEIGSCMWDYLHLTIPPRIKLPRIAAITRKLPRSSLFSYQIIWMAGGSGGWFWVVVFFSLLLAPFPFLKYAGTRVLYKIFFYMTLSGCLKSCLDHWPWGRERESLNLICVATYFF